MIGFFSNYPVIPCVDDVVDTTAVHVTTPLLTRSYNEPPKLSFVNQFKFLEYMPG